VSVACGCLRRGWRRDCADVVDGVVLQRRGWREGQEGAGRFGGSDREVIGRSRLRRENNIVLELTSRG
jgi:hypothetical protein